MMWFINKNLNSKNKYPISLESVDVQLYSVLIKCIGKQIRQNSIYSIIEIIMKFIIVWL